MKIGDKIVVFTDIHLGLRNNERRHNIECWDFVKWMIEQAHEFGATKSIFCGDWHHYRSNVHVSTLNYTQLLFELLNSNFEKCYQLIGNHDLFYKDKREINSIEFARSLPNFQIINEITKIGDVTLVPWLVENEHKRVSKTKTPYIFGHFEIPHFLMNAMISMPDTGKISLEDFKNPDQRIFSGHFHKRQIKTNSYGAEMMYMGNCFPHSYADAWDDQRGIMLLELGKEPIFKAWPNAPRFRTLELSRLIEDPGLYIDSRTNAKVTIDLDITYEEATFIRESMINEYNVRDFKLIPNREQEENIVMDEGMVFETVDQIVIDYLNKVDSNTIDKDLLIDIYNDV